MQDTVWTCRHNHEHHRSLRLRSPPSPQPQKRCLGDHQLLVSCFSPASAQHGSGILFTESHLVFTHQPPSKHAFSLALHLSHLSHSPTSLFAHGSANIYPTSGFSRAELSSISRQPLRDRLISHTSLRIRFKLSRTQHLLCLNRAYRKADTSGCPPLDNSIHLHICSTRRATLPRMSLPFFLPRLAFYVTQEASSSYLQR